MKRRKYPEFLCGSIRGVIVKNKKILLVKEKSEGIWETPGGIIEKNENDPLNVCKREVLEETGYIVDVNDIVDFVIKSYPRTKTRNFHVIYKCSPRKQTKIKEKNIEEIKWFSKKEIKQMLKNNAYDFHDKNVLKMFVSGKL